MNKKLKIGFLVSLAALILVIGFGVSKNSTDTGKNKTENNSIIQEAAQNNSKKDADSSNNETASNKKSVNEINTDTAKVIEKDKDTGSETVVNTDGDVVVKNDAALKEAESNSKRQEEYEKMVDDSLADIITDDTATDDSSNRVDKDTQKSIDKVKKADSSDKSSNSKTSDSSKTSSSGNSDEKVDKQTKELFNEMGWDTDIDYSQGDIPEDAVWTIDHPDRNYDGVFSAK